MGKRRFAPMIFILLLAPALGELLSGSSPPEEYFNPVTFVLLTVLYGGGALLIREARARWKLGWSIIFLAVAYGIIEEGLMVQSFFNHHHPDLGILAYYSRWAGVNWSWTIMLTVFHATISTMIPIMAADLLFPDTKDKTLLKKGGTITWIAALALDVIIFAAFIILEYGSVENPYVVNWGQLFIWSAITAVLIYLAYKLRSKTGIERNKKLRSPFIFFIAAFFMQLINLLLPYMLVQFNVQAGITVALQLILCGIILLFVFRQVYLTYITYKHKLALVIGTISSYAFIAVFRLFDPEYSSMFFIGVFAALLMVIYMICVILLNKKAIHHSDI